MPKMPPAYPAHLRQVGPDAQIQAMARKAEEPKRLIVPMPKELVDQIDEYRWANRIPSRAEAIRQLIKKGLKAPKK
jgi:hypothetical protein